MADLQDSSLPADNADGGNEEEIDIAQLQELAEFLQAQQQQSEAYNGEQHLRWVVMVDTTGFNIVQIGVPEGDQIGFDTYEEAITLAERLVLLNDNQILDESGKIISVTANQDVATADEITIEDDVPQGNGN